MRDAVQLLRCISDQMLALSFGDVSAILIQSFCANLRLQNVALQMSMQLLSYLF